jgi:hypothetical protein
MVNWPLSLDILGNMPLLFPTANSVVPSGPVIHPLTLANLISGSFEQYNIAQYSLLQTHGPTGAEHSRTLHIYEYPLSAIYVGYLQIVCPPEHGVWRGSQFEAALQGKNLTLCCFLLRT